MEKETNRLRLSSEVLNQYPHLTIKKEEGSFIPLCWDGYVCMPQITNYPVVRTNDSGIVTSFGFNADTSGCRGCNRGKRNRIVNNIK